MWDLNLILVNNISSLCHLNERIAFLSPSTKPLLSNILIYNHTIWKEFSFKCWTQSFKNCIHMSMHFASAMSLVPNKFWSYSQCGSGSRRAKVTQKTEKSEEILCFVKVLNVLLWRLKAFSLFNVLHVCLRIKKIAIFDQKISAVILYNFWSSKPWTRISKLSA